MIFNFLQTLLCMAMTTLSPIHTTLVPLSLFPLNNYSQNVDDWVNSKNIINFNKSLLPHQFESQYFNDFKAHWLSSWSSKYVEKVLSQKNPSIVSCEKEIFLKFDNRQLADKEKNYGENFRLHTPAWIENIKANIDLKTLENLHYQANQRAILTTNAEARGLPTNDPAFYSFTLPGQGYPFDNLQMSSLWAGTPAYLITKTKDKAWTLILTPAVLAWVPSNSVAMVDNHFIEAWEKATHHQLAAIIHNSAPLLNTTTQTSSIVSVGSVFPVVLGQNSQQLLFPLRKTDGTATLSFIEFSRNNAILMPYSTTPEHFSKILKSMIGRPYGWGGIYFYNDCSEELRSIYTPFGIWLPRHSSVQVTVGKMDDESSLSTQERIRYLMDHGHPLMTIVYIGHHIFQYVGNFDDPNDPHHSKMPMSYQNVWGLSPKNKDRRAVIGQSVLLPILNSYPEDRALASPASKEYFQLAYLDESPPSEESWLLKKIELEFLMSP